MTRLHKLRDARTSISTQIQLLEMNQERLLSLGFTQTLLPVAILQVEAALELVESEIRAELNKGDLP